MGYQIIKQPDNQYAIFSSFSDTFVALSQTREEVFNFFMEIERERLTYSLDNLFAKIDADKPAYYQFTLTWDEAVKMHQEKMKARQQPDEPVDTV